MVKQVAAQRKPAIRRLYGHFMNDSLRRNSSFLLLSSAVSALFGFVFWLLCARFAPSREVGFATSLLAYISLFSTFTTLGLPNAIIRFLPHHNNKDGYFSTVMTITTLSSTVIGGALLYAVKYLSPKLAFAIDRPDIFLLLLATLVVSAISNIADAALLAHKDARQIFIKMLYQSPLKVILPLLFFNLSLTSILVIAGVTTLIGTAYETILLYRKYHRRFIYSHDTLANSYRFTAGNLLGTIFGVFPATLVPIIVLNELGASLAAYFYIAMQFSSLLSLVSSSSAQAYLSEASNDRDKEYLRHFVHALKNLYSMLIPALLVMILVGTQLLRIYGHAYFAHAAWLLVILSAASLFVGINWLGDSLLNVQKRPFAYGAMNFVNAVLVVIAVRIWAHSGLLAVGFSWLAAQALTVVIYLILQGKLLVNYKFSKRL